MTWGYHDPYEPQQAAAYHPAPIITVDGAHVCGLGDFQHHHHRTDAWAYDHAPTMQSYVPDTAMPENYATSLAGPDPWAYDHGYTVGQVPSEQIFLTWVNRPTKKGLYFVEVKLPKPQTKAELNAKFANAKSPFGDANVAPAFFGAFTRIENGQQVMVIGEDVENAYRDGSMFWGMEEGEYQFTNALYMWGDLDSEMVEKLMWYVVLLDDTETYGLDPLTTTVYFNAQMQIVYMQDAQGRRYNPNTGTLGGFPAVFLVGFAAFLFSYFGWFGATAEKVATKILTKVIDFALKGLKKTAQKLKELMVGALGKVSHVFVPLIGFVAALTVLAWLVQSDSGTTTR